MASCHPGFMKWRVPENPPRPRFVGSLGNALRRAIVTPRLKFQVYELPVELAPNLPFLI